MRKSSLGRRSSTHIPVRVPSLGGSSAQKTCSGGKKKTGSLLKQPGYTQTQGRQRRSQSEDRESYGGRTMLPVRSSTSGNLPGRGMSSMTPITPRQSLHANLPTSSVRPPRNQTMSSDANRRMSSFGGAKSNRKDSRPITEKAFQQTAQSRVQRYFDEYENDVLSPGDSLRPMNTKMFVDMMDHMLKNFDSRIVITKSNYLEELPNLLKKYGYRSKVDRSWLMTVNTPHSWPHVIAVLSWLVDSIECMSCVDPLSMMYTTNIEPNENEEPDDDIEINLELVQQLKSTYRVYIDQNKTIEDKLAIIDELDSDFVVKQIIEEKCTDEDFDMIQRGIQLVKEEVEIEAQRRDSQLESNESLVAKRNALLSDCQSAEGFIDQSNQFVCSSNVKLETFEEEVTVLKSLIAKKQEELHKLQEKINCQTVSLEEKEQITKKKHDLHRMIQYYEKSIRELDNTTFSVEIKLAEEQRKLDSVLVEYNKIVAENTVVEPRLKNVEVKIALITISEDTLLDTIFATLKGLKEEYRGSILSLNSKQEDSESVLWRIKQDMKESEEEIAKETSLLEGLECDIENQEDLINKETHQLKEKQNRCQKLIKETMDEISHFDPAKLEVKKQELKKLEHDYELLQKRAKTIIEAELAVIQEIRDALKVELEHHHKRSKEFTDKYL